MCCEGACLSDIPEMSSMQHGVAALGPNLNQLVDKCIAEADSILHLLSFIVSGNAIFTQPTSDCTLLCCPMLMYAIIISNVQY